MEFGFVFCLVLSVMERLLSKFTGILILRVAVILPLLEKKKAKRNILLENISQTVRRLSNPSYLIHSVEEKNPVISMSAVNLFYSKSSHFCQRPCILDSKECLDCKLYSDVSNRSEPLRYQEMTVVTKWVVVLAP